MSNQINQPSAEEQMDAREEQDLKKAERFLRGQKRKLISMGWSEEAASEFIEQCNGEARPMDENYLIEALQMLESMPHFLPRAGADGKLSMSLSKSAGKCKTLGAAFRQMDRYAYKHSHMGCERDLEENLCELGIACADLAQIARFNALLSQMELESELSGKKYSINPRFAHLGLGAIARIRAMNAFRDGSRKQKKMRAEFNEFKSELETCSISSSDEILLKEHHDQILEQTPAMSSLLRDDLAAALLSDEEAKIFKMLCMGMGQKEIAEKLGCKQPKIAKMKKKIIKKLTKSIEIPSEIDESAEAAAPAAKPSIQEKLQSTIDAWEAQMKHENPLIFSDPADQPEKMPQILIRADEENQFIAGSYSEQSLSLIASL